MSERIGNVPASSEAPRIRSGGVQTEKVAIVRACVSVIYPVTTAILLPTPD